MAKRRHQRSARNPGAAGKRRPPGPMDRRKFVRTTGGILVAAGLGACSGRDPDGPARLGTIRVLLTGLNSSATSGGTAVVTPVGGGPAIPVELPASGDESRLVEVGEYSVLYTPPTNHELAPGEPNPRTVTITEGATTTVTVALVFVPPSTTGTIQVNVTGLTGSPANGGSAVAQRTDASGSPITINVSSAGSGSDSNVPAGTYTVTYTAPNGFNVAAGVTNPVTGLVVAVGATATATFAVQPIPVAALIFASDWSTAQGNTILACRDGTTWSNAYNILTDRVTVIPATGLGFPAAMANVLAIRHDGTPFSGIDGVDVLTLPTVGNSIFFRLYWRMAVSTNNSVTQHPVQTKAGTCAFSMEWVHNSFASFNFEFATLVDGAIANFEAGHRFALNLTRDTTYRVEWQLKRTGSTTWELHGRIYNSADVLVFSDANFVCTRSNHGGHTLASVPAPVITIPTASCLQSVLIVNQGDWNLPGPNNRIFYGGYAVSLTDWCGAYQLGEGP